jgi:NADH:ubiquinone oxidoreductase subunit E
MEGVEGFNQVLELARRAAALVQRCEKLDCDLNGGDNVSNRTKSYRHPGSLIEGR